MTSKVRNTNPFCFENEFEYYLLLTKYAIYLQMYSPDSAPKMIRKNPSMNRISFKRTLAGAILHYLKAL